MSSAVSAFVGVVLLSLCAVVATTVVSAENEPASTESRIRNLLMEKRGVLEKRLEHLNHLYALGQVQFEHVLDAEMDLLGAKLDLAMSDADRISLLESQLKNRRSLESLLQERFAIGNATSADHVDATVERIDAEIVLERAKSAQESE